ncbi:MAG: biliverdin-producing heme oxygenase [Bernardetiaceae bacterium]|nr:biliverdin-producing heme oxygenase [Bernardetiaceae bacterium]
MEVQLKEKTTILHRLKTETRASHDSIEENGLMRAVAKNNISKEDYLKLLLKFYGFHAAAEPLLMQTELWTKHNLDMDKRKKTTMLEQDLRYLGFAEALTSIPLCEALPPMQNDAEKLGFMYVVEGSTLGGQILSHQLHKRFGFTKEEGASYFNAYGKENLRSMWAEYQQVLTTYCENNEQAADIIVANAIQTFDSLNNWLKK